MINAKSEVSRVRSGKLIAAVGAMSCALVPVAVTCAELEEIIVTSQRRAENLQDVGIAVTTLSGDDLAELGFDEPRDLMMQTPGLMVSSSVGGTMQNFSLRGVGLNEFAPNNSSPVAVHVDDVYMSYSAFLNFGLFDLERVEVLKGPQGTLFGRNTTGGAVNFYSRKPTDTFEAAVTAEFGNYESSRLEGFVSGPIAANLSGRIAGFAKVQGDGPWFSRYLHQSIGKVDPWWGVRGQLSYEPSSVLSIDLNLHGGREVSEGPQYTIVPVMSASAPGTLCQAAIDGTVQGGEPDCVDRLGFGEPDSDPFTSSAGFRNRQEIEGVGANLSVTWDMGFADLVSVTGYEQVDRYSAEDADGTPKVRSDDVFINDMSQISEELRLLSPTDSDFSWITGLYFSADTLDTPTHQISFTAHPTLPIATNTSYTQEAEAYAAYAHATWRLRNAWELLAGVRYTDERRSYRGGSTEIIPPTELGGLGSPYDPERRFTYLSDEVAFTDWSWKVGANYRPSDDILAYASISKGFKSGGFNGNLAFNPAVLEPFDEETLISYEVGIKADLLDNTLRWNSAIFYYDYTDIILTGADVTVGPGGAEVTIFRSSNLSDAVVRGIESDIWWTAFDGLDLKVGLSYIDSELTNPKPGNEALEGDRLTYTPEWQGNWMVRYTRPLGQRSLVAAVQVDGTYKGDFFAEVPNTVLSSVDGYALVNARASMGSEDGKWELALWGQNLTDEAYVQYLNELPTIGVVLESVGYPRTYGVEISYKW